MASDITTLQCPNCSGALVFVPESGKVECEFCGSAFTAQEVEEFSKERLAKAGGDAAGGAAEGVAGAAVAGAAAAGAAPDSESSPSSKVEPEPEPEPEPEHAEYRQTKWDDSTISDDWGEAADNLVTYSCSSCGGEIICEATTAATQCPYCGNSTVIPTQFSIGYKPNYVIPFKMTKPQAQEALRRHYRGKLFLPSEFSQKNQIEKLQGTYVPFWLFNGDCTADATFECTKSSSHRDGDYIVTETDYYRVVRRGAMAFDKVPVDASTKMPDDLMDSLEPFDYAEMIPFTPSVFAGFIADKYDVSVSSCTRRADLRCEDTVIGMLRGDISGYDRVTMTSRDVEIVNTRVDYALLPVYTIKTKFEGKTYLFAMNGQTGRFVGDLPVSKKKFWMFCAGLTAVLGAALYALGVGGGLADFLWLVLS